MQRRETKELLNSSLGEESGAADVGRRKAGVNWKNTEEKGIDKLYGAKGNVVGNFRFSGMAGR